MLMLHISFLVDVCFLIAYIIGLYLNYSIAHLAYLTSYLISKCLNLINLITLFTQNHSKTMDTKIVFFHFWVERGAV